MDKQYIVDELPGPPSTLIGVSWQPPINWTVYNQDGCISDEVPSIEAAKAWAEARYHISHWIENSLYPGQPFPDWLAVPEKRTGIIQCLQMATNNDSSFRKDRTTP